MADIPLYQRTELPPVIGRAKPPYSLADRSGEREFAQTLTKFSGALFNRVVETRAANEISEFMGAKDSLLEGFNAYIRNNPGASFEDMETQRDKMMTGIKALGQKPNLTGIAKNQITDWFDRNMKLDDGRVVTNEGLLYMKSQAAMQAIVSRQEAEKSDMLLNQYIAAGKEDEAIELIKSQSGQLFSAESVPFRIKEVSAKIAEIKQEQLKSVVLGVAQSFRFAEGKNKGEIDLDKGQKYIKGRDDLTVENKLGALRGLSSWYVQEQKALEERRESDRDVLGKALRNEPILDENKNEIDPHIFIENSSLDEGEQERYHSKIDELLDDPTIVEQGNPIVEAGLAKRIDLNEEITATEIWGLVGLGREKGIRAAVAGQLVAALKARGKADSPLNRPAAKNAFKALNKICDITLSTIIEPQDKKENELRRMGLSNELNQWLMAHEDATDKEVDEKVRNLVAPEVKEAAKGILSKLWEQWKWPGGMIGSKMLEKLKGTSEPAEPITEEPEFGLRPDGKLETVPSVEFNEIWPSLTDKQKTNIWAAMGNGYTANEILAALEKK